MSNRMEIGDDDGLDDDDDGSQPDGMTAGNMWAPHTNFPSTTPGLSTTCRSDIRSSLFTRPSHPAGPSSPFSSSWSSLTAAPTTLTQFGFRPISTDDSSFHLDFSSPGSSSMSCVPSRTDRPPVFAQPRGRAPRSSGATGPLVARSTTPSSTSAPVAPGAATFTGPSTSAAPAAPARGLGATPRLFSLTPRSSSALCSPSLPATKPPTTTPTTGQSSNQLEPQTPSSLGSLGNGRRPFNGPVITPRQSTVGRTVTTSSGRVVATTTPRTGTARGRHDDNVIIALVHGRGFARNEVGLAAINMTACELHLCQMSDSHGFVKTMTKMNLFRPSEVLMPDTALPSNGCSSPLAQAVSRFDSDITLTPVNRSAFNDTEGIQYVQKLAVVDHLNILVLIEQKFYTLAAVSALMTYLENVLNLVFSASSLRVYYRGTDQTVIIDSETANRLEVVSSLSPTGGPSLLSALNGCQTAAGKRLLRSNLLEPMTDVEAIRQRLDAVEELASRPTDLHRPIKDILYRLVDVERAVNQCIVVPKNPSLPFIEQRINAVLALKHIVTLVAPLRAALSTATSSLLVSLARELASIEYDQLLTRLQDVLDERVKPVKGKIGMQRQRFRAIKMGVDLMLDVCRRTYNDLQSEMEEYVEELSRQYQMSLTLANTAQRGYHLQQPYGHPKKKGEINYRPPTPPQLPAVFVCVKKQGNQLGFTTHHLLVMNERIKSVAKDIEKFTNAIIEDLLNRTRSQIGSLHKLRDIVCQLDVLVSFAQVSSSAGFCRPEFGGQLVIRCGRHPILNHFSPTALISNDTEMNEESNFHVITGANMSGKSTYIRQVMLLQIMAQIGCFVPASSASFRIVDQMFSRLGTRDRLENNASSFSLEMTEMNYIVRNAGPGSLVIIDELCSQTASHQGSAICWSLCEALLMTKAWVLIATHTPLLGKLHEFYFNVSNYHMEVIEEEREDGRPALNYTHVLKPGVTLLENYGMKLARMFPFPAEVLTRAQELIPILSAEMKPLPKTSLDCKMNKLNSSLHTRLLDISRRMDALPDQTLLMELERLRNAYKEELNAIVTEHEKDR